MLLRFLTGCGKGAFTYNISGCSCNRRKEEDHKAREQAALEALGHLQSILFDGCGWLGRKQNLLLLLENHGLSVVLYGVTNSDVSREFVLISSSAGDEELPHSSWTASERTDALQRLSASQAVTLLPSDVAGNTELRHRFSSTCRPCAAAVPLLLGQRLVGALWLEEGCIHTPQHTAAQLGLTDNAHAASSILSSAIPLPPAAGGAAATAAPPLSQPSRSSCSYASLTNQPHLLAASACPGAAPGRPCPYARHASALLQSKQMLQRLSLIASLCLAGRGTEAADYLPWLADVVARLGAAASMSALVAQLCSALEAHVQRDFVLRANVCAALVPPGPNPPMALVFCVQGFSSAAEGASSGTWTITRPGTGKRGCTGTGAGSGTVAGMLPSGGGTFGSLAQASGGDGGGGAAALLVARRAAGGESASASVPKERGSRVRTNPVSAGPTASSRLSAAESSLAAPQEQQLMSPFNTHAAVVGHKSSNGTSSSRVVIQLSEPNAAGAVSRAAALPALHATPFPLHHTLLQAVLARQRQQQRQPPLQREQQQTATQETVAGGGAGGAAAGGSAASRLRDGASVPGSRGAKASAQPPAGPAATPAAKAAATATTMEVHPVVEDTRLYVQNVHNPVLDVYMLFGRRTAAAAGASWTSRTGTGIACAGWDTSTSGGVTTTTGSCGSWLPASPQSLVLLTVPLGEEGAALGLYMCFPQQLPRQLLEAVRESCQELLDEGLAGPMVTALRGHLAPEYDTLKAATPGSYAVVHGVTAREVLGASSGFHDPALLPAPTVSMLRRLGFLDASSRGRKLQPPHASLVPSPLSTSCIAKHPTSVESVAVAVAASTPVGRPEGGSAAGAGGGLEAGSAAAPGAGRRHNTSFSRSIRNALLGLSAAGTDDMGAIAASRSAKVPASAPVTATRPTEDELDELLVVTAATGGMGDIVPPACDINALKGSFATQLATADAAPASLITVDCMDAYGTAVQQQLGLLMGSIQATVPVMATAESIGVTNEHHTDLKRLQLTRVIGVGGGGVVLKGLLNGTLPVAVKILEMPDDGGGGPTKDGSTDDARQLMVRRQLLRHALELAVQSSLSHPNIVQFYCTFSDVILRSRDADGNPANPASQSARLCLQPASLDTTRSCNKGGVYDGARVTCLVAEYCDAGSLGSALESRTFPRRLGATPASTSTPGRAASYHNDRAVVYDFKAIYMTLLDVALALRHLHSLNLVHRDVKPANLLLKSDRRDYRGFTVKLSDFGFVLKLTETAEDGTRYAPVDHACGTVTHMAPECAEPNANVDSSVDIYSFGIVMWELLAGGMRPFPAIHPDNILCMVVKKGARPVFGSRVPKVYQDLACRCWHTNPRRRPHAGELVNVLRAALRAWT